MSALLDSISLRGFRAYRTSQSFNVPTGGLAIFAPNGKGKTSLVDAIEFLFSENGTIKRLGERRTERLAGPEALQHVDYDSAEGPAEVTLNFKINGKAVPATRPIKRPAAATPNAAQDVLRLCKPGFVIRGYELRAFVENSSSEDRYKELAAWFGLGPLLDIQQDLRSLRRNLKERSQRSEAVNERQTRLRNITGGSLSAWSESEALSWINKAILGPLSPGLALTRLSAEDETYKIVERRKLEEAALAGTTVGVQLITAATALRNVSGDGAQTGAIPALQTAARNAAEAAGLAASEREKAASSVFSAVWDAALPLLEVPTTENCPVCFTPLSQSPAGSRDGLRIQLQIRRSELQAYYACATNARQAAAAFGAAKNATVQRCSSLESLLSAARMDQQATTVRQFREALSNSSNLDIPDAAKVEDVCNELSLPSTEEAAKPVYETALNTINAIIDAGSAAALAIAEREELTAIYQSVDVLTQEIEKRIALEVSSLLDQLRTSVNDIYRKIQESSGGTSPAIQFVAPQPDDRAQRKIDLVVDLSGEHPGLVPSGYLSDSQIHTLALSLRLCALRHFNKDFRFAVLDDVVTSYDADHRKAIAGVLASEFSDFQFLILTHDERFFVYLKEHMGNRCDFHRITHIDGALGPRLERHQVSDDVIEGLFKSGKRASNEIRQAEEEWLLAKAREFGINLRIRDSDKPYAFDRGELAAGIASYLKEQKIKVPPLPGFTNSFFTALQSGTVENFGSHFQEDPNATWSSGDEQKRWQEFKAFRDLFVCPSCNHGKFKRPKVGVRLPLCYRCETPFSFMPSLPAA